MTGLIFAIIAIGLYFLPTMLAFDKQHNSRNSILIINFFLGWTMIGWVVALAMAANAAQWNPKSKPARYDLGGPSTAGPLPTPPTPPELPAQRELPKFGPI